MPLLILILCVVAGTISSCDAAHALSISESQQEYDDRIDFESIRDEVCQMIDCPRLGGLHIDELNVHGTQIAAAKVSVRYAF